MSAYRDSDTIGRMVEEIQALSDEQKSELLKRCGKLMGRGAIVTTYCHQCETSWCDTLSLNIKCKCREVTFE